MIQILDEYLKTWHLVVAGDEIVTHTSRLWPVLRGDRPAMLKITTEPEERRSIHLLGEWQGRGAVRVFAIDERAVLMERPVGKRSLRAMSTGGEDDETVRILSAVAHSLHLNSPSEKPANAVPLRTWFSALYAFERTERLVDLARGVANELLGEESKSVLLHGDIHHDNVLDGEERGWLAIDPKGIWGAAPFDYANILRNPDNAIALQPGRIEQRVRLIAEQSGYSEVTIVKWTLAYCGLSIAWEYGSEESRRADSEVGTLSARMLGLK